MSQIYRPPITFLFHSNAQQYIVSTQYYLLQCKRFIFVYFKPYINILLELLNTPLNKSEVTVCLQFNVDAKKWKLLLDR